jgi:hypothetical protein
MNICRFLSILGSLWMERPQRMPAWLRRHMERCDSCRRSSQAELEVVRRLQAGSLAANQSSIPPRLKQRILAQVQAPKPATAWLSSMPCRWITSGAAVAVCVAVLILLMPRAGDESGMRTEVDPVESGTVAQFSWSTGNPLDRVAGAELLRWSKVMHEPLELEWARTVEDGHRLLAAVVQSCVPDPAADAFLSRTRQLLPSRQAHSLPD